MLIYKQSCIFSTFLRYPKVRGKRGLKSGLKNRRMHKWQWWENNCCTIYSFVSKHVIVHLLIEWSNYFWLIFRNSKSFWNIHAILKYLLHSQWNNCENIFHWFVYLLWKCQNYSLEVSIIKIGVGENIKVPVLKKSLCEFVLALFGKLSIHTFIYILAMGPKIGNSVTKREDRPVIIYQNSPKHVLEKRKRKQDGPNSISRQMQCACVCVCVWCVSCADMCLLMHLCSLICDQNWLNIYIHRIDQNHRHSWISLSETEQNPMVYA